MDLKGIYELNGRWLQFYNDMVLRELGCTYFPSHHSLYSFLLFGSSYIIHSLCLLVLLA